LTDEDPEQFRNLKSATSISAKKATPSRTAHEAKHARPSATTEAAAPKLKRVVQDVIAPKHKGSSSAKGQRKEPKPKAKRVLAGLPAYARDPFGKIASPIFKTWASEQANPWDIPDEDVDLVMPLLWSTSTGKKWKSLEDVERQTAKNIVSGVLKVVLSSSSLCTDDSDNSLRNDCSNGEALLAPQLATRSESGSRMTRMLNDVSMCGGHLTRRSSTTGLKTAG
jgi:hypothetical protein